MRKQSMRVINSVFIVLFIAMLILPLVFVDLSSNRVSVQENRMLAAHPDLADIKNHPGTFIRGFDAWFKDSTGFRERLLALYNVIGKNTWLNGFHSTSGHYVFLVGEEGHRYVAGEHGSLIPVFQGKKILSDEKLANMADKLEEIKTFLDRKGIPLIIMFCTGKEDIYPEFYPKSIKRGPEPIQLDVITRYLQEHTGVDVFNIRQALLAEKDNYLMYNVSGGDFGHYTEIGGFLAYRELMRHINKYFPELVSYELRDVDISFDKKGETCVSVEAEKMYKELAPSFFDDVEVVRPFSWENRAYENTEPDLPVILFLRDSFVEEKYFGKYVAQHFNKTIMIHFLNIEHFEEYIAKYKPDIVVFEAAPLHIGWFADNVAKIPELP